MKGARIRGRVVKWKEKVEEMIGAREKNRQREAAIKAAVGYELL